MQEHYGVCVDGIGSTVSVRHAAALAANLPAGSRLTRLSMSDGQREAALWTLEVRLLAICANALNSLVWQNGGGKRSSKPKPILPPEERGASERKSGGKVLPGSELVRRLDEIHALAARQARNGEEGT